MGDEPGHIHVMDERALYDMDRANVISVEYSWKDAYAVVEDMGYPCVIVDIRTGDQEHRFPAGMKPAVTR